MIKNAMSLKSIINNIAKVNKVSAQSVLQTYMLERLLQGYHYQNIKIILY